MSLFQAYSAVGGFFVALGALLIFFGERIAPALEVLPRSRAAGFVLWGGALAWFLWHLTTIPAVDLAGFPRSWLLALFGGAGLLAFKFLPDLLALRGLAVLALFSCSELLSAGFGQLPYSRVIAGTAYLLIVLALWGGAAPYVWRDALFWTARSARNARIAGALALAVGAANLAAGFLWLP